MKVYREVENPTNGVLKKRITDFNRVLVSGLGRTIKIGAKVWTPDGTFKIFGGKDGKVFVSPIRKKQKCFVREYRPEALGMKWVVVNSMDAINLPLPHELATF